MRQFSDRREREFEKCKYHNLLTTNDIEQLFSSPEPSPPCFFIRIRAIGISIFSLKNEVLYWHVTVYI